MAQMAPIPGTVRCVLCNAVLRFQHNDKTKFDLHLRLEHMVNFDTDIILAVCLMEEDEMEAVKNVMFAKLQQNSSEGNLEEDEDRNTVDESEIKTEKESDSKLAPSTTENEVFSCDNCKKQFKSKRYLRKHEKNVVCIFKENNESVEVDNENSEESKLKPNSNEEVEPPTLEEIEIKSEEVVELPVTPPRKNENPVVSCDKCKKIFKTNKSLKQHNKSVACSFKENTEIIEVDEDTGDEDETVTTLKEVTDEDIARSRYFSNRGTYSMKCSDKVINRITNQNIEDFNEDERLLPGWKIKTGQVFSANRSNGIMKKRVFLTPNKKRRISTSLGVIEYLRIQGRTESELYPLAMQLGIDRRRFAKLCSDELIPGKSQAPVQLSDDDIPKSPGRFKSSNALTELSDEDISKSKYFSKDYNIRKVLKTSIPEFKETDSMLPGWMIKTRLVRRNGRQRKWRTFLTPRKNRSIITSTGVLEYLRLQGKQKEELSQIAKHLGVRNFL